MADKRIISVITGTTVKETGVVSFKFMFDSKAPHKDYLEPPLYLGKSFPFGWVHTRKRDDNEFDPWKLMRNEENAIGDDGIGRVETFLFKGGEGQVLFAGAINTEEGMKAMLKNVPNCIILMTKELFDRFEIACKMYDDIELHSFHFDGELATS